MQLKFLYFMQTNSDFNELLDSPVGLKTIRQPYFNIIEWSIMIINGLFTFFGVLLFWGIAFKSGTWLLFINPPCFILLFGLTPIFYIRQWRTASIEYDKTNNTTLLQNISMGLIGFVHIGTGIVCTLILLMFAGVIYGETASLRTWLSPGIIMLLLPFVILGPVQFLFIRMTKKITGNITNG